MTGATLPTEVELFRVRMSLRHPHRAAHGTVSTRDSILVRVGDGDGVDGWGECPALAEPTYTSEYTDGAWAVLRDHLVPAQLEEWDQSRAKWLALEEVVASGSDRIKLLPVAARLADAFGRHRPPRVVGHRMAHAGLGDAWSDQGARHRLTVADGPVAPATAIPTTTVLGLSDDMDVLIERVAVAPGPVKLKVDGWDGIDRVEAVRSTFPDLVLAVDANGSLHGVDFEDRANVARLDRLGLRYVEQPMESVSAVLINLRGRVQTPICLDESIDSSEAAWVAIRLGAVDVINLKPARVDAGEVLRLAVEHSIDCFVGGMLETGVGRATALMVAQRPGCTLPTDLGPSSQYWETDITEPILADERGWLIPPTGPGIGVTPDPDRLEAATIDRLLFRR